MKPLPSTSPHLHLVGATRPAHDDWVAVIDDHHSLRGALVRAIRLERIHAEGFATAEEFLACESTPRCLVVDMQLPGMSGHELLHHVERIRPPGLPIVLITGHDDLSAAPITCCAPLGRLRKPFEIEVLLSLVRPFMAVAQARQL